MRVLVVPKWYPWPDRPVLGSFCREQAQAVSRTNDVVVLASDAVRSPAFGLYELHDAFEDGLRTLRVRYRRPRFRPAAMACQLMGMLAALRRLRAEGWSPEVVHAHVYSAALPALVLARLSRAALVVSEHYTGFQRGLITGYDRFTARVAFRYADVVSPVSQDLAARVAALAPKARIEVVANVVDTDVFHPPAEARNPGGRLLTVAALTEKKGHADLFLALASLGGRALSLDLVGDGELRGALAAQAAELGLADVVRFHGAQPKPEVARLMRRADLFVLPSYFENLPVVLLEALASGLPAVATAVGGVPELVGIAGDGLRLCPPHRPDELASAIARGLELGPRSDAAELARRAGQWFGYEAIGHRWSEIYARVAVA